ncbi:hypothetical protein NPIL_644711 [Nephila pilipes]|uniref:Uncharacterized protein n=1 Tax=Nephila pilipes TaxID=299642 RepID=A0A8X6TFU2_NEPPI|nr:hypothetical protein NPIL_644711 [Nephila pilipes]
MTSEDLKQYFVKNLTAADYYEEDQKFLDNMKVYFEIVLTFIYDVIKSRRFEGQKLLEIGSGATVHNIASASAYFPIIVQSDFLEDNCKALRDWLQGNTMLDWSKFLDIPARLEKYRGDRDVMIATLESRIRRNVKAVVHCDVHTESILRLEEVPPEAVPPYDLIISILCFEVTCSNFQEFVGVLRRVNSLLRKGGGILMSSILGQEDWHVKEKTYLSLKLSLNEILSALDMAGFGHHDIKEFSPMKTHYLKHYDGYYCVASEKL